MSLIKIFFVLPSLSAGGAERILTFVAKSLSKSEFQVKLIVIGTKMHNEYSTGDIDVLYLNKSRFHKALWTLFILIFRAKPSIVMSSISHVNIAMGIMCNFFPKIKFIGRESSVMSKMAEFSGFNRGRLEKLIKFSYPKLTAIVCQSDDMKQDLINTYFVPSKKLFVINNPITELRKVERKTISKTKMNFITVGRLMEVKGHARIIQGLSKIKNYDFHYTIVGSGKEKENIKDKIRSLNLSDKVTYIDYTANVLDELVKSDYFLQGSYVEGFPNALLESCSVGTPVIAFKAPGGTKDIIVDGKNGFLVENDVQFIELLNDLERLKSVSNKVVVESVLDKFDPNKIINSYQELLLRL